MRKILLFALQTSVLCCISEAGFAQQTENANATSRLPVFMESIDGNISPDQIPMAHIYEILSSAMVDNGPGRCSDSPQNQSEIRTVAPCRTLIEGLDPAMLEQLGEATVAFNLSEHERWKGEFCMASETNSMRSSTAEELSSFLERSEKDSQQNKIIFFEEKVSEMFDAEDAKRIFDFANNEIMKNTRYTKLNYALMMSVTRVTPSGFIDSLCK